MTLSLRQKEKIGEIAGKYNLRILALFGSRGRGDFSSKSDYDIAYLGQNYLSLLEEANLATDLAEIFKDHVVDISSIRNASPLLLRQITKEGKVLYESFPGLFTEIYLYALRTYQETLPLYQAEIKNIKSRLANL